MPVKVLVVDDSMFFRRRIIEILNTDPNIEVMDTANDGAEAVEKACRLEPDVITMDVEMPVMNGIEAVRKIMQLNPTPILMFSSVTTDGAQTTLDALEAGAIDYFPKRFTDIAKDKAQLKKILCQRINTLSYSIKNKKNLYQQSLLTSNNLAKFRITQHSSLVEPTIKPSIIVIGTSTGGPLALQTLLKQIPKNFSAPILIVQHMPAEFTFAFAKRLNEICKITIKEASNGCVLRPATAYLAPGGKQMMIKNRSRESIIVIESGDKNMTYKPSVDVTFSSLANDYHGKVLAIILTGMGTDGCRGAKRLKDKGAIIWAQDEASCVIYGMPSAVIQAGLTEKVLPIKEIGINLANVV